MQIVTIGSGFVGAAHSAVVANNGHKVLAYDLDKNKIEDFASRDADRINSRIYEKGLAELVKRAGEKLRFTSDIQDVAKVADKLDTVYMCLPTPAEELDRPIEERCMFRAARDLAQVLKQRNCAEQTKRVVIVNKSTVPIGTAEQLKEKLTEWGVSNFGVASNPEFLVEGKAVDGCINPDRVVLGVENEQDGEVLRAQYRHLGEGKIKMMKVKSAEAVKLLANFELYSRIIQTFHVAGRLCESQPDMDYEEVIAGVTSDLRLPKWGHYTSMFAGGSCFDKDARNLRRTLEACMGTHHAVEFLTLVIDGNLEQLEHFYERPMRAGFSYQGKKVALLGTAFKKDTNDVRMSGALPLTEMLSESGAQQVRIYDPQATNNFIQYFEMQKHPASQILVPCSSVEEALEQTDMAVIATDWTEFQHAAQKIEEIVKPPYLIMDGRRSLRRDYKQLAAKGYTIVAVGSPILGLKIS